MRFSLIALAFLWCLSSSAQSNIIKFDAFQLLESKVSFSYEHLIGSQTSLQITTGVLLDYRKETFSPQSNLNIDNENISAGWHTIPEFRYYLAEMTNMKAPSGAHVSVAAVYSNVNSSVVDLANNWSKNEQQAGAGAGLGMQWFFVQRIGLELDFKIFTLYRFSDQSGSAIDGYYGPFQNSNITREFNSLFSGKIVYGF